MHGKREFLLNFIESQTILCGIVSENSFVKIIENPGVEWRFLFPYFSHFRSLSTVWLSEMAVFSKI